MPGQCSTKPTDCNFRFRKTERRRRRLALRGTNGRAYFARDCGTMDSVAAIASRSSVSIFPTSTKES